MPQTTVTPKTGNAQPRLTVVPPSARPTPLLTAIGAVLGAGMGTSAIWGGLYDLSLWGPVSLGVFGVLLGLLVAAPPRRGPVAAAATLSLAALAAIALASTLWAESTAQALVEAHRWALYAALFALLVLLPPQPRRVALWAATAGITGTALSIAVAMVGGAGHLFPAGRLTDPLGYVNGQAGFLLLGLWPLLGIAERARAWAAGLAAAGATLVAGLVLLTQSRGAALGALAGILVILAALPERRTRAWLLLVTGAAVAAVFPVLRDVYENAPGGGADALAGDARRAGLILLAAAGAAGAVWLAVTAARERLQGEAAQGWARAATAALAVVALAAGGLGALKAGALADRAGEAWDSFTSLDTSGTRETRFLSGGGSRYDYWRVARDAWEARPLGGLGAGNYDTVWFRLRQSNEDVRQPHSIELQILAELGLLGAAALLAFLIAIGAAGALAARRPASAAEAAALVGGAGAFTGWLVHTSVDWLHLLPGVSGVALAGAAVLVGHADRERAGPAVARSGAIAWRAAAALVLVAVSVGTGRLTLAEHYRTRAADALADDPARAVELTATSLSLHGDNLPALYIRAAAQARANRYFQAREVLQQAVRAEPSDFLPHALLGDLAVRRGDFATARADYTRAMRLNPRDEAIARLAADPRSAVQ